MNQFLYRLIPIFILGLPGHFVSAQTGSGQLEVAGSLVHQETGESLPYATVAFYRLSDSTIAGNTLTEEEGGFSLMLKPGEYYAVFHYIGFEDKVISSVDVSEGVRLEMGTIQMVSKSFALEEVEVTAERSQMELKLDRRVFNVGKDLTNAGNSAADILDKVPSVSVDPEGNVSLRGSEGVQILVNGKPSGLLSAGDTEALLRMQGDIIESIEVITNPSARYEAEGEAGIINIILNKNKEKGVNGSFSATVGHPHNYGAAYNLNFHRSNLNFFSNFGIDYRKSPGGGNSSRSFFEDGQLTEYYTTDTDQERGGLGGYMQVGTDWSIDEKNVLTGALLYRLGEDDNNAEVTYRDFDMDLDLVSTTFRDIDEIEREHNLEGSLFYKRTFDTPEREWTVDAKYILDDDTEIADYRETVSGASDPAIQKSSNTEDEINFLVQTDYIHPLGDHGKFEVGLRATFRTVNNDYFVDEQQENGEFITLPGYDDRLRYTENIYAAYGIYAHEFGQFAVQAGVRLEQSDITASLLESEISNDQDYLSAFPSVSTTYKISENDQLQASYSRRLSRPRFRLLLPFSNFNDPRNTWVGNPDLEPEFTNSFELGHLRYFEKGSLLTSVYYRHTTGVIERLTLPAGDGTSTRFPINLATRNSYGLEFSFSYDPLEWWNVTTDMNLYRSLVDGEFEGEDLSSDALSFSGRATSRVDIGDRAKLQASYRYRAPRKTTQGKRLASSSFDLAASLDVFGGRGTFTLTSRDLFNTRKHRTIIDLPDYQSESEFQWRQSRSVVLSFHYRLNQEKSQKDLLGGNGEEGGP